MSEENIKLFLTRFKSDISRRKHGDNLQKLTRYLQGRNKDFKEATFEDILQWLQEIDKENMLIITKERYRRIAFQYFRFLKVRLHAREDIPVPEKEEFQFTEKDRTNDVIKIPLDLDSANRVLGYFKFTNMGLYTACRILKETGMRVGELVNIKKAGISIEERRIYTTGKRGISRYFFPSPFKPELGSWLTYQEQVNLDAEYLFPPLYRRGALHVHDQWIRANLEKAGKTLGLSCSVNPHAWRDLLNTCRADKFKLVKERDALLSILLCQEPQGVNASHYLKMYSWKNPGTWQSHRDLYDQLYPY